MTNLTGFVNIIKPTGMGSTDVVTKVKKILGTKKVGHLGTLDPAASGVLPIAIGKATKFFDYFLEKDKVYFALVQFGLSSDTLDSYGEILERQEKIVTNEMISGIIPEFLGEITQIPPKFSAVKINGKRACDLARENVEFEIKSRKITIYSIDLMQNLGNNKFLFKVHCSAGTYIRTLFSDMARALETISITPVIIRTKSGLFDTKNAVTLENLEKNHKILSISDVFCDFLNFSVDGELAKKLINGVKIKVDYLIKNIKLNDLNINDLIKNNFFLSENDNLIGMYKVNNNYIECITYLYENR